MGFALADDVEGLDVLLPVEVDDDVLVVAEVAAEAVMEILDRAPPLEVQLDAVVGHHADVLLRAVQVADLRRNLHVAQDAFGAFLIEVDAEQQAVVEGLEIQSEVVGAGGLPRDVLVDEILDRRAARQHVAEAVIVALVRQHGHQVLVVADGLVAHLADRAAELEHVDRPDVLHEILLVDAPSDRHGGEEGPSVALGEFRRTVVTRRHVDQVFLLVVVGDSPEVGEEQFERRSARNILHRGAD